MIAACARPQPQSELSALETARLLAQPEQAWAARLAGAPGSFAQVEGTFDNGGARGHPGARLFARLGADAQSPWWFGASAEVVDRLAIRFEGANSAAAVEKDGVLTYSGAYPSTDVLVASDRGAVEVFYLLRDAGAPRRWTWKLSLPPGMEVRRVGDTLEFLQGGEAQMVMPTPRARDAEGQDVAVDFEWKDGRLHLALAEVSLAYPVLVDPVIEVIDWTMLWGPRSDHQMVYDSVRGRTVLFGGGFPGYAPVGGTWEYDGTAWQRVQTQTEPTPRDQFVMAFDSFRGVVVLHGGLRQVSHGAGLPVHNEFFDDTWEYDGQNWVEKTPTLRGPQVTEAAATFDSFRNRVLLFGGYFNGPYNGTWEWDGQTWTQRAPAASPPARARHAMAYDPSRNRTVLFGGNLTDETWEWDGNTWYQFFPANAPIGRSRHAMAYDALRGRVVMHGGSGHLIPGGTASDLWEWDGSNWTTRNLSGAPPARSGHALAFDAARGRMVLFGGLPGTIPLGDTWEYGATGGWTQNTNAAPLFLPPPCSNHAMVFDAARGNTVLYGGRSANNTVFGTLFTWDGIEWTQRSTNPGPTARQLHAMVYDSARERVVLFGG